MSSIRNEDSSLVIRPGLEEMVSVVRLTTARFRAKNVVETEFYSFTIMFAIKREKQNQTMAVSRCVPCQSTTATILIFMKHARGGMS